MNPATYNKDKTLLFFSVSNVTLLFFLTFYLFNDQINEILISHHSKYIRNIGTDLSNMEQGNYKKTLNSPYVQHTFPAELLDVVQIHSLFFILVFDMIQIHFNLEIKIMTHLKTDEITWGLMRKSEFFRPEVLLTGHGESLSVISPLTFHIV